MMTLPAVKPPPPLPALIGWSTMGIAELVERQASIPVARQWLDELWATADALRPLSADSDDEHVNGALRVCQIAENVLGHRERTAAPPPVVPAGLPTLEGMRGWTVPQLAALLAGIDANTRQAWIDQCFDAAESAAPVSEADLSTCWRLADIAGHLTKGARPEQIRVSAFRGIVADWREDRDGWAQPQATRPPAQAHDSLWAAIDAAAASKPPADPVSAPASNGIVTVNLRNAADIAPEAVEWLWGGYLPAGKLVVLAGAPGTGKTTLALALAATLSAGRYWPDGTRAPTASVAIWSGEDDPADTLIPRLRVADANLANVHFVSSTIDVDGKLRPFDPSIDVPHLTHALAAIAPKLLVIDPIVSAVSGDSHKNGETRRALQPLVDLAGRLDCAVLGISHFSKGSQGRDPVERVTGSLAFGALARLVFAAAIAAENDVDADGCDRLFVRSKSNLGLDGGGFRYRLEQKPVPGYPTLSASGVCWGSPLEGEARALLATAEATTDPEERNALESAEEFLLNVLASGPQMAKTIRSDGENAGHAWRTLHRAADRLNIERRKEGMKGHWVWRLPLTAKMPSTCHEDAKFTEQDFLAPSASLASSGDDLPI